MQIRENMKATILFICAVCACTNKPATDVKPSAMACSDVGCIDPAYGNGDAATGENSTGWWFSSGSWNLQYGGPEDSVITGFTIDIIDNGPGNARPSAPVTVALRTSRDGSIWTTVQSIASCGCGAEQTLAPKFVYQPASGEIVEMMLTSATSDPSYVISMQVVSGNAIIRPFWPKIILTGFNYTLPMQPSFGADGSISVVSTGAGSIAILEIPSESGETMISLDAVVYGNGATDGTTAVSYAESADSRSGGTNVTIIGGVTDHARVSAWGYLHIPITSQKISNAGYLIMTITANNPGYRWGEMHGTFVR